MRCAALLMVSALPGPQQLGQLLILAAQVNHQGVKALLLDHAIELVAIVLHHADVVDGDVINLPVSIFPPEMEVQADWARAGLKHTGVDLGIIDASHDLAAKFESQIDITLNLVQVSILDKRGE